MNDTDFLINELKKSIAKKVLIYEGPETRMSNIGKSGSSKMDWIFDFRAVMLQSKWLDTYAKIFWSKYASHYPFQVGGMETAGIPLVTAIVMKGQEINMPVNGFYIRKSRKKQGLMKQIEGTLTNDPIILVDDLINSGQSLWTQILLLEKIQAKIVGTFAILALRDHQDYQPALDKGIKVDFLFNAKDFGLPSNTKSPETKKNEFEAMWIKNIPSPSLEYVMQKSALVIDTKNLYVGGDSGTFYALNQKNGDTVWSFDIEKHPYGKGIFSCPALHKNSVYFGAYDGNVYSLNKHDGTLQWKYDEADWIGSSPALAPDIGLLFIGLEFGLWRKRGGISAVDLQTGKRSWVKRHSSLTHASPLYIKEEGMVVIGSNNGVVYAYSAKDGQTLWEFQTAGDIKTCPAYDNKQRLVLVPSMDGFLYALDAVKGAVVWTFRTGGGIYSNPLIYEGRVLVASLDKSLYAINLDTGVSEAEFVTGGRIFSSPVQADNSIWIGSNDGKLYELEPKTLEKVGSYQTVERIVNAIAYNAESGQLFVPTIAGEIYCLKRKNN